MNNRRVTLGPLNSSTINSRASSNGRMSIGPGDMKSRMSLGMPMVPMTQSSATATAKQRMSLSGNGLMPPAPPLAGTNVPGRRSSIAPRSSSLSSTARVADPRNIGDKSFMSSSIRTLVEFLAERGYDQPISPKILTKPTNKDYYMIALFLFKQIDPNFAPQGKVEDEIVGMFKLLGYPYPVAKSHISAVGSPHAWPHLLATLMWLIELLRYDEAVTHAAELEESATAVGQTLGDEGEDVVAEEKAFYRYLSRAYAYFIAGRDDQYAALEAQFVHGYEHQETLLRDQLESVAQRSSALAGEIEEVKRRSALLPTLDAQRRELQRELAALEQAQRDRQGTAAEWQTKIGSREREFAELKTRTSETNKEIAVLRDKIAGQEISPEDVVNMVSERERLEEACQTAYQHRQTLQRRVVESEMSLRDKVQALEDSVRAYHAIAEDMKLIPQSARNSRGEDLSIVIDVRSKNAEGLLKSKIKAHIVPILQDLKRELGEATLSLRGELLVEQETVDELDAKRQEMIESREAMETRIRRADQSYKREKESLESAGELQRSELDALETRLLELRDVSADEARVSGAQRRLAELSTVRRVRLQDLVQRKTQMLEDIMDVLNSCASHRETIQSSLEDLKTRFTSRLESFLDIHNNNNHNNQSIIE